MEEALHGHLEIVRKRSSGLHWTRHRAHEVGLQRSLGRREQRRFSTPPAVHIEALLTEYRHATVHLAYEPVALATRCVVLQPGVGSRRPASTLPASGATVKNRSPRRPHSGFRARARALKRVHVPRARIRYAAALADVRASRERQEAGASRIRSLMQDHGRLGRCRAEVGPTSGGCASRTLRPVQQCLGLRLAALTSARRLKRALATVAREPAMRPWCGPECAGGVGPFTAIRLRLELGDIRTFAPPTVFRTTSLTPSEHSPAIGCSAADPAAWPRISAAGSCNARGRACARTRTRAAGLLRSPQSRAGKKRAIIASRAAAFARPRAAARAAQGGRIARPPEGSAGLAWLGCLRGVAWFMHVERLRVCSAEPAVFGDS